MAPEGRSILLTASLLAIFCVTLGMAFFPGVAVLLTVLGLAPLALSLYFFRDPVRRLPADPDIVVAPADGKVIEISKAQQDPFEISNLRARPAAPAMKLSIFMSPFDVHVNRIPIGGKIIALRHARGKFSAAFKPKASLENERQYVGIESRHGPVGCVQIAGWVARRIVCHLREGQQVATGERFGMIKFGSRVDLYLPQTCELKVKLGQKVRAGETIIGTLPLEK